MVQNSHNFLGDVQDVKRDNVRKRRSNKKGERVEPLFSDPPPPPPLFFFFFLPTLLPFYEKSQIFRIPAMSPF